jgi:uncharacterized RmlC-like cupin family protein
MVVADIPAAATSGRHTHPGEEVAYILEGAIVLDVAGKSPVTLKTGQGFVIPAGVPHSATNKASAPARVLANYIIEKGSPSRRPRLTVPLTAAAVVLPSRLGAIQLDRGPPGEPEGAGR